MWSVNIFINLKKGVLDAQGAATQNALESLGFGEVKEVRIGKCINIKIEAKTQKIVRQRVEDMCKKLLANPVIEDFSYKIEVL
ncbi:MAG: phosphoribosylformylglycinamidine synthase subunit PurS [Candidatus Atribacteria bacterium]|jgi:phosphoribosylformylglycinamidine synthase subunit PurS|nr:phosphoribosylformylglycinamidine synthase subunit PurS [Candidatus Atribacteria bacterium]